MEAECIRDSILAVSGRLDQTMYGLSVHPYREKAYEDRRLFPGPLDGAGRRSVYVKVNLMESPRFLSAFNLPGGKVTQGRRDVSNVPAQALAMMNDPIVWQQAEVWANRLVSRDDTVTKRLQHMFQTALGRPASRVEQESLLQLIEQLAQMRGVTKREVLSDLSIWTDASHLMFNQKEFVYIP
jgi:hypothetical protein